MLYTIDDLTKAIENLQKKKAWLESGGELCEHHYNHSDRCYEYVCAKCSAHIGSVKDAFNVPVKGALCLECQKTPEEKAQEKAEDEIRRKNLELEMLARLKRKYPKEC